MTTPIQLDEATMQVVRSTIAAKLIEQIDNHHRDAILAASVEAALKEWSFKGAIENAVAESALVVARRMLEEAHWQKRIAKAVEAGCTKFIRALEQATYLYLRESFAGIDDNRVYSYHGALLKHLKEAEEKTEGSKNEGDSN